MGATMRIPTIETFFLSPWPAAARRVLPSSSPEHAATALWGPVFAWCAIDCLSSSINPDRPKRAALEIYDRLRLREPMAHAFGALGMEGEEAWRAAARIKVLLIARADAEESQSILSTPSAKTAPVATTQETIESQKASDKVAALSTEKRPQSSGAEKKSFFVPALWRDSDVRWLTGIHHAEGHDYLVQEPFVELLWWLQLPALLKLAGESAPNKTDASAISDIVQEALAEVAAAGYRADRLLAFDRRNRNKDAAATTGREPGASKHEPPRSAATSPSEPRIGPPLEPAGSKKE